jgi:hypothetical protein
VAGVVEVGAWAPGKSFMSASIRAINSAASAIGKTRNQIFLKILKKILINQKDSIAECGWLGAP